MIEIQLPQLEEVARQAEGRLAAIESRLAEIEDRLLLIEALLQQFVSQREIKEAYSISEMAEICGKTENVIRIWCREGRLRGIKRAAGCGTSKQWEIPHEEVVRYRAHGLRPSSK
ncbi:helix-turn-helix domain-containing protein [Paludisphaera rhizosphaerae]|uniref:helix-turn-helix domain-containing protein n=1 Tax=Paludisphaera rhizosphaerae TaxID=2711216 RepID=UPI0013EA305C|nr:helix-turn-helix domain-containing protein [Paludisphaera rhizosphaerae]